MSHRTNRSNDFIRDDYNNQHSRVTHHVNSQDSGVNAITSYGVIVFHVDSNNTIRFMISKRRDSIPYQEFVKNTLEQHEVQRYIKLMTREEQMRLVEYYDSKQLDKIWEDLWLNPNSKFWHKTDDSIRNLYKNMDTYIDSFRECIETKTHNKEIWGFPKGRRQYNEKYIQCATREFSEETKFHASILHEVRFNSYEELYRGMDMRMYRTLLYPYYVQEIPETIYTYREGFIRNRHISEEVDDIKWLTLEELIDIIDSSKYSILKNVHDKISMNQRLHGSVCNHRAYKNDKSRTENYTN
jgi:ADP-ribose pyrophosphatase YjhB (NUDIX family)